MLGVKEQDMQNFTEVVEDQSAAQYPVTGKIAGVGVAVYAVSNRWGLTENIK